MVGGPEQMAADPEEVLHDAVHREKALRVGSGFKAAHLALTLKVLGRGSEARSVALAAERGGLGGIDGYPSIILYEVFDEQHPAALSDKK